MPDRIFCRILGDNGAESCSFVLDDEAARRAPLSVGRSASCAVSLKNKPGVTDAIGRVHFTIVVKDDC